MKLRAYLVDDEPLALERLRRLAGTDRTRGSDGQHDGAGGGRRGT